MKVTFKTVKQESFVLDLEETAKIADVKAAVEAEKGTAFPAGGLLIISQGKILKDETTLADNKITGTGFLVVMVQAKPKAKLGESSSAAPAAQPAAPSLVPATTAPGPAPPAQTAPAQVPSPATAAPATAQQAAAAPGTQGPQSDDPYLNTASQLSTGSALEQNISQICEMGFPREEVMRAMRAAYNNPDRAVEYLMNGIPASAAGAAATPPAQASSGDAAAASPARTAQAPAAAATGPNAQPLDMFAPQAASGGGGGGQGGGPLDFLRNNPQFQGLRNIVRSNPAILQPMLQELAKQNPQLLQTINQNQSEFLRLLSEPAAGGGSPDAADLAAQLGAAAQGLPAESMQVHLTPEDIAAIERLEGLGFDRMLCIEAYLACDKDETLAANYLLEHPGGMEDMA